MPNSLDSVNFISRSRDSTPLCFSTVASRRSALFGLHKELCAEALELMTRKNVDYSSVSNDDPYANFRSSSIVGVQPVDGILMRMTDKISRIHSFVKNGSLSVKNESYRDSLIDIINYAVLIGGMISDKGAFSTASSVSTLPPHSSPESNKQDQ